MSPDAGGRPLGKFVLLTPKAGRGAELREVLERTRRAAQFEPGTLEWTSHEVRGDAGHVALYELFESEDAAAAHDAGPAISSLIASLGDLLAADPVVHILDVDRRRLDP
ncbi:putative quinol monooxygenase [Agromyces bauzanensis]